MAIHLTRRLTLLCVTLAGCLLLVLAFGGCAPAPQDVPRDKGEALFTLRGLPYDPGNVTYSPDGELLAAAERNGTIVKVWKASDCTEVLSLKVEHVSDVAFSPDSKQLALGSHKDQVRDARTGEMIRRLDMKDIASDRVCSVAWSPNGRWIGFTSSWGSTHFPKPWPKERATTDKYTGDFAVLQLFDATDGTRVLESEHPGDAALFAIAFSAAGNRVAARAGEASGGITLWEVPSGKEVLRVPGRVSFASRPVFSPDGAMLACSTRLDRWGDTTSWSKIDVWNATTGKELCLLQGHRKNLWCLAFSPDSAFIAAGAEDGAVQIWNVTTQRLVVTLAGHKEAVSSVAFSPDGKRLASGAGSYDRPGEVKVWDVTPYVKLWEK